VQRTRGETGSGAGPGATAMTGRLPRGADARVRSPRTPGLAFRAAAVALAVVAALATAGAQPRLADGAGHTSARALAQILPGVTSAHAAPADPMLALSSVPDRVLPEPNRPLPWLPDPVVPDPIDAPAAPLVDVATTTTVSRNPATPADPTVYGQPVIFDATIAPPVSVGTVSFTDGATPITGCTALTPASGLSTCATSAPGQYVLSVGPHTINASYSGCIACGGGGTITYTASAGLVPHTVIKADTTTALVAAPSPSYFSQTVTFTATVTADAPSTATPDDAEAATVVFSIGGSPFATVPVDSAGVAVLSTDLLTVGFHTVTASYGGDSRFNGSSDTAVHIVNKVPVTVEVDSLPIVDAFTTPVSARTSVFGQNVIISATVTSTVPVTAPGGSTPILPAGTVLFRADGAPIGIALLDPTGMAQIDTFLLAVGQHTITAEYAGNAIFESGLGTLLPEPPGFTVVKANTAMEMGTLPFDPLLPPPVPAISCATRPPGSPLPGPVAVPTLPPPGGDASRASVFGQTVIVTGTVSIDETVETPGAGAPSGVVSLLVDGVPIDVQPLDAAGRVTYTVASMAVGTRTLALQYGGDPRFEESFAQLAGGPNNFVVNKADTLVRLISQSPPNNPGGERPAFNEPVIFTVEVTALSPGAGVPTGNVRFFINGQAVGDVALGTSNPGEASFATNLVDSLEVDYGFHRIEVKYLGDDNFRISDSHLPSFPGVPALLPPTGFCAFFVYSTPTTTELAGPYFTPGGIMPIVGQNVSLEATVNVGSGLAVSEIPTGTLSFSILTVPPTSTLVPGPIPGCTGLSMQDGSGNPTGKATCEATFSASGPFTVRAIYGATPSGKPNFKTSLDTDSLTVLRASTAVVANSTPNPSLVGQTITLSAAVSAVPPGSGTPAGTVTFDDGGVPIPGCTGLVLVAGSASCSPTNPLSVGDHPLKAIYTPSPASAVIFKPSQDSFVHTVQKVDTTTSIADSPAGTSAPGTPVNITVTVAPVPPGGGVPGGTNTVELRDAGLLVATGTPDGTGTVVFALPSLAIGSHPFKATYLGNAEYNSSSSPTIFHVVGGDPPDLTLSSDVNPSFYGQPVTFTADGDAGAVGCTIIFKDSTTTIGMGTGDGSGDASLIYALLTPGNHAMRALVDCNDGTGIGVSPEYVQAVQKAPTSTTLTSSANPSVSGQPVTFSATVATAVVPSVAVTPTGTVVFKAGATTLGVAAIDGATGIATLTTAGLAVGGHSITAAYAGDDNFLGSAGGLLQTVSKADADVVVTTVGGITSTLFGQSVTFVATLTAQPPGAGTPTGTIDFLDGASPIAGCTARPLVDGVATCTTSALPVGPRTIVASYPGDAAFDSATGNLAHLVINSADLAISAVGDIPDPVRAGDTLELSFVVENLGPLASTATITGPLTLPTGFTALVGFTAPAGWSCSGPGGSAPCTSTAPMPAGGTATFTALVQVLDSAPSGMNLTTSAGVTGSEPDPRPENDVQTWRTTVFRSRR